MRKTTDNLEKFKSNKRLLNILACGKPQFTTGDVMKLYQLPGNNTPHNAEPESNPEQQYYDKLNLCDNKTLIDRERELEVSVYNKKIEINMIHNLLLQRGSDLNKDLHKIECTHNRFIRNNPEENRLYCIGNNE